MPKFNAYRSLEEFERILTKRDPDARRVLGLDLGTNCGVAIADVNPASSKPGYAFLGQWDLSVSDYETGPLRMLRLQALLSLVNPDLVGLEDVKFAAVNPEIYGGGQKTLQAVIARVSKPAEFLGALKCTAAAWAEARERPLACYGIQEIKKFATGKGQCNKLAMVQAANRQFAAGFTEDEEQLLKEGIDNVADALWVCAMTVQHYFPGLFGNTQPAPVEVKPKAKKQLSKDEAA
jgi:hypothetical protein